MENLIIKGTDDTPDVYLSKNENIVSIHGMSLPEDVKEFYRPIIAWFDEYFSSPNSETTVNFGMTYFNTASSKIILDLLFIIKKGIEAGHKIKVTWGYEEDDEEMEESGQDYADIVDIPIECKEINLTDA